MMISDSCPYDWEDVKWRLINGMVDDWIYHNQPAEDKPNSSIGIPAKNCDGKAEVLPSGNLT